MTKPDVMWVTDRQALIFHRGRIWFVFQEPESEVWWVYTGGSSGGGLFTIVGKPLMRFPIGGYHAALVWIQNWRQGEQAA